MINFRFHLVSLIAVFLALAIGVVMGSTVIDQAIVDGLRDRIKSIEEKADDTARENDDLRSELDRFESYVDDSAAFAVTGRLDGVPVAVLAARGAGDDDVQRTVELAQVAGAAAPGVLWLEDRWALADDESVRQLAEIVGDDPDDPREPDALLEAAWVLLAERLAAGVAPASGLDVLDALAEAGFVEFEGFGDEQGAVNLAAYPGNDARALLVDGTDVPSAMHELVEPAGRAALGTGLPLVVAEVYRESDEAPDRGVLVAPIRGDEDLNAAVSTVDDLDRVEGRVTAVIALADLGRGVVGQYGYGAGADASLPEHSAP